MRENVNEFIKFTDFKITLSELKALVKKYEEKIAKYHLFQSNCNDYVRTIASEFCNDELIKARFYDLKNFAIFR